jgi:hypothetical protein
MNSLNAKIRSQENKQEEAENKKQGKVKAVREKSKLENVDDEHEISGSGLFVQKADQYYVKKLKRKGKRKKYGG